MLFASFDILYVANFCADFLNNKIDAIFRRTNYHIVGVKILELLDTKAALELADAIKTMFCFVKPSNTPEVVALNTPLARIAHRLHMEKWRTRIFRTEFSRNAIVIARFIAIENHEVLCQNIFAELSGIEFYLIIFCKSLELFG